jgi:hypothetical protein
VVGSRLWGRPSFFVACRFGLVVLVRGARLSGRLAK